MLFASPARWPLVSAAILISACTAKSAGFDPPNPTVTDVRMTPDSVTLPAGDSVTFTAQGLQQDGSPIGVTLAWSATGGTVSVSGRYHAGSVPGVYRVMASTIDLTLADTSIVTISDTSVPPPAVAQIQVTPASATLAMGAAAAFTAQGYQANGAPIAVAVTWSATGGTVSTTGQYLAGATAGTYRVVAGTTNVALADTAVVTITDTTTPPPPPGVTVLLTESFEDAAVAGRGWYDNTNPAISTVEHYSGAGALQMAFPAGGTIATKGGAVRHKFAGTDRVFLRYWVKYSANWIGSGVNYHPHEFHFVTNLDGDFIGPSATHLTTYVEHVYQNGGIPRLALTDASNIDITKVNVDLTHQTETRSVNGCNGNGDSYPTNCYQLGTAWRNEKVWLASAPSFTPGPGPGYKNAWHKVEAYFQLNSIQGGIGIADGVTQYWFDGQLIIDHHNVLLRTGQYPAMQFTQFLIAPYIGVGSPVAQTMWVDDLVIATGPVP